MKVKLSAFLLLACFAVSLPAQNKLTDKAKAAKAKAIKTEISKLKARIADLQRELLKYEPAAVPLRPQTLAIGQVGSWNNTLQVVNIADEKTMLVRYSATSGNSHYFILEGVPTKGLADDQYIRPKGTFEVKETRKVGGRTYLVVTLLEE